MQLRAESGTSDGDDVACLVGEHMGQTVVEEPTETNFNSSTRMSLVAQCVFVFNHTLLPIWLSGRNSILYLLRQC